MGVPKKFTFATTASVLESIGDLSAYSSSLKTKYVTTFDLRSAVELTCYFMPGVGVFIYSRIGLLFHAWRGRIPTRACVFRYLLHDISMRPRLPQVKLLLMLDLFGACAALGS